MAKPDSREEARWGEVERIIGVSFRNKALLREALTHRSYLNESKGATLNHNERLEFLGDAALDFVVASHLYRHRPPLSEGAMTDRRGALVNNENLAQLGEELSLARYMLFSHGQEKEVMAGDPSWVYIIGGAVEALIGAIVIDRGLGNAELFVLEFILPRLERILASGAHVNPKTRLQELTQEKYGVTPEYEVQFAQGPEHDRVYVVAVKLADRELAIGHGRNIKQAGTEAARAALQAHFNLTIPS